MNNSKVFLPDTDLRARIVYLARHASIEIAHSKKIDDVLAEKLRGRTVFIPSSPKSPDPLSATIAPAVALKKRGLDPVPHIVLRNYMDIKDLGWALQALHGAGIDKILLLAGDKKKPGQIADTLQIIHDDRLKKILAQHGIKHVLFAGHPDGNPNAPRDSDPDSAVEIKNAFIAATGLTSGFITQLCFDTKTVRRWAEHIATDHANKLPVIIGIYGSLRSPFAILRYARWIGLSPWRIAKESPHMIPEYLGGMVRNRFPIPDQWILDYAQKASGRIAGLHVYTFGQDDDALDMLNALADGKFEITRGISGKKRLHIEGFARHYNAPRAEI